MLTMDIHTLSIDFKSIDFYIVFKFNKYNSQIFETFQYYLNYVKILIQNVNKIVITNNIINAIFCIN